MAVVDYEPLGFEEAPTLNGAMRGSPQSFTGCVERAIEDGAEHRHEHPSQWGHRIHLQQDRLRAANLHAWVRQHEIDDGQREGVSTLEVQRIKELEREVRELRKPTRSWGSWPARFSPRRSSTAASSPEGLRRPASPAFRGRVDLSRHADRPVGVLASCTPAGTNPALCSRRAQRDASWCLWFSVCGWPTSRSGADKVWRQLNREGVASHAAPLSG